MMAAMAPEALSPLVGRAPAVGALSRAIGLREIDAAPGVRPGVRPGVGPGAASDATDAGAESVGASVPGGIVLLGGDAGVGKSRVLTELSDRATAAGWRVLLGHCLDFGESALPYLPFTEAFGRLATDDPDAAADLVRHDPTIGRLLPAQRTLAVAADVGQPDRAPTDRASMFESVHQALRILASSSPLLLVVEDVHWADQSTRELLTYLLTRRFDEPVAIVASYRSDDLNRRHPLRSLLAEWYRLPSVVRQHVDPLSDVDLRDLVAGLEDGQLGERARQRIVERAEGNPFFAEELVAAAGSRGTAIPTELADLLLVRLDRLDDRARLAVRTAAVAGRRVSHALLASASGLPPDDLDEALRAAVDANVLVPTRGDGYLFRHALLAEAVYDDLLPGERVRLHAAYARSLCSHDAPGTAAELARHARAAHDLPTAAVASVRAGDEAMTVGGPDDAARHYELALDLLADPEIAAAVEKEADGIGIDMVELVGLACGALVSAGHAHRALALAQDQLAALPEEAPALDRVWMLYAVASTAMLVDDRVDVLAVTSEAMRLLPDGASQVLRARVMTVHARASAYRARDDDATRWSREAQTLARGIGRLDLAADASTTLAWLDDRAGQPARAEAALLEAIAEARRGGAISTELRSLFNLAGLHYELGRLDEALARYQETTERARDGGVPWGPYGLEGRAMTGLVAIVHGDWKLAETVSDTSGESPPDFAAALLQSVALDLASGRGDVERLTDVPKLRTWWRRDGLVALVSGGAALELAGHTGDLERAEALHADMIAALDELWQTNAWLARARLDSLLLGQLGTAAARATASERAVLAARGAALHAQTEAAVDGVRGRRTRPVGPEARAWLARGTADALRLAWLAGSEDAGTADGLVAAWRAAVTAFETFGHVYETARSRARLAAALKATGDNAAAANEATAATEVAQRLGARPLLAELKAVGARRVQRHVEPAGRDTTLTPREREVLVLVSDGRSNAEIARALFISAKTVSVHVSNIMAKLGAASRTEAVAVARRDGLLT